MGCVPGDSGCSRAEGPQHSVALSRGFWLGRTEVTVASYARYAGATGQTMPPAPAFNPGWALEDHPIVNVSWEEASAYCAWAGGRLPTEAEWERAARGGRDGLAYPWGNGISHEQANHEGTGSRDRWEQTSPVASFEANGYGLLDVSGNVWEWCADWYSEDYYASSPSTDPRGPSSGRYRVLRGGSWDFNPGNLRASFRFRFAPSARVYDSGFRCARDSISR
jgi:formylglycine-generating enzyme required for sulfatase activity